MKKCPYCAEEIEESAIECKHSKTLLNSNINENAVKSFLCRICGKGQMLESIKTKHVVWPGIFCIIISIILYVIPYIVAVSSIPNIFYESMASTYIVREISSTYVQGYLHENLWTGIVSAMGIILFLFGIVFSFVYNKKVRGWKCDYCSNFIKKINKIL